MPSTVNKYLNVPNTGDLPGAWGTTAVNFNMSALDGILGGAVSISLAASGTTLTLPSGASFTPGSGPNQSQNAMIKFTGTLTATRLVTFTMPGFYIIYNMCSVNTSAVVLAPSGNGQAVGAPPWQPCHIFYDGTDIVYVNMPVVGSALDLHQSGTSLPAWMQACSVSPYLIKDGSTYSVASYTALAAVLGSTFGGNGVTTFGLPDERARARIAVDLSVSGATSGRITATTGGAGIIGTAMGTSGGSQFIQSHAHTASVTDTGHTHEIRVVTNQAAVPGAGSASGLSGSNLATSGGSVSLGTTNIGTASLSATVNATGSGGSGNMMPFIISFLPLIKT